MIRIHKINSIFNIKLKPKTVTLIILAFLPIYIFYCSVFLFTVNIPYWDDYDSILNFTNNFQDSNLKNKILLIFSQHNEHRIVFNRAVTLVSYYLTGKINFKLLVFIGNMSLIGLTILLLKSSVFLQKKVLYFIPAIFLIFQPQYWGGIYFATPSLSNLSVIFFVFASLYLLKKESVKYFIFSLLLALLATFTNGNGIIVFFSALPVLIYQRKHKRIILWISTGMVCALFYFYGYIKPAYHPSIIDSVFVHPLHTLIYLFHFVGLSFLNTGVNYGKSVYLIPLVTGIFFTSYFIYLIRIKFYKKNAVIISFILFLFLTSFAVSLCRSAFDLFPSRYRIISVLISALFYLSLLEILPENKIKRFFPILLTFSILFNLISYYQNYNYFALQKEYLSEGLALWKEGKPSLSYPDANRANSIISTAIAKRRYSMPLP